jgi:hypothetical protein
VVKITAGSKKFIKYNLMTKKPVIVTLFLLLVPSCILLSQTRSAFSGDPTRYKDELVSFMGSNLNSEQTDNLNIFLVSWDSAAYSKKNMNRIINISSQLSSRYMRPVPHFNNLLITLNYLMQYKIDSTSVTNWLMGLSEVAFSPRFTIDIIDRYIRNAGSFIKENALYESGSVKWKVKNSKLIFLHDSTFYVHITDATLTCYSQKDSTEIYNVTGNYYPEMLQFRGTRGTITWEKAGYPRKDVYAEISNYIINTAKNSFTIDSAKLKNEAYFKEPVYGVLNDQTISYSNKDKATFPRFDSYTKEFRLKNLYKGVDYEGGLSFEGANVKGTGRNSSPATIKLYRNDTLYLKIKSKEFLFSKIGLNSQETAMTLYLDKDSIYHVNLGFSYFDATRQVNLFRTNTPVSKSPYFDSFHKMDIYFEYLTWDMNESKIILSRTKGSAIGHAQFESSSFFNSNYFLLLMGMDEFHPLNRLVKFSEWFYSETFPVEEFGKWLNRPLESVTALCIDMANKGFLIYDRINNEVTITQKTKDFLDAFAKKIDYDVINIYSETKAPTDNAILDLKNFKISVNGVSSVFLSDSQRVGFYPYKQRLVIEKNRNLEFDGVVEAGLFTVFGHNFSFSYDTFKIRLQKIDSLKISVESDEKDKLGNPIVKEVNNLMHPGSAELMIDDPNNKSGRRSLKQYPIINVITSSYIFYDRIAGLENIYKQGDFYFKVDPFTYENIDHYKNEDMNLPGEFIAGNILKPMKQTLIIQEDNSLGFNMNIPNEGIEVYENKGRLFNAISMDNKGLTGSGTLKHLSSTTKSEQFNFFPDSMITQASTFNIEKDESGVFPVLKSTDVAIKWLTQKDEWHASNTPGKSFEMFENSTTLDGDLTMTTSKLNGKGAINTTDSKITSDLFNFASNAIRAEKANYNLKSPNSNGYSFIAENANTDVNFDLNMALFHLNTDSSLVKFPELQYICTMTDFAYDMENKVLNMEQKGKVNTKLLTPEKLLREDFANLEKPTFFATNSLSDTVSFSSGKGNYNRDQEYIEAENINYIHIADALIQPENGKIVINRGAKIKQMQNAIIAVNNKHLLHSAKIDIESSKRYTGSAVYDYVDENKDIQQISFPELMVDTLTTTAKGYIPVNQSFKLSPAFSYAGDVTLSARADLLSFTGAAGITHNCSTIKSYNIKFKSSIDPNHVLIPISEKPRDINDNLVFSGSYINTDSMHIYPAFLSQQKSYADIALVSSNGYLYYDKAKGKYIITSLEKLADPSLPGNMISFDKNFCVLSGEGNINFGAKLDLVKLESAGNVIHLIDSGNVNIEAILALDFYFSPEALKLMADEIRLMPSLKPVNLNTDLNNKGMKDLLGVTAATQLKEELDLFGTSKSLPKEFAYELLLNDVKLYWNRATSSFRSTGKIGIGFIGPQPINMYVDGYIEIQRRRTGDMIDIYLKADESTWYYFSYFRGVMMTQAGNNNYNTLIVSKKLSDRKHPESTVRIPYTYMIASEDRLGRFLKRMTADNSGDEQVNK